MTSSSIDTRALLLPPSFTTALTKLFARQIGAEESGVATLLHAIFGDATPSFGQVQSVSVSDVQSACTSAGVDVATAKIREIAALLPKITPSTPVCDRCGESSLANTGGKIFSLDVGIACPFCTDGVLALVPMKLRKVAWTDGRLVEPQTAHDLRVQPGSSIPLDDTAIVPWIGGWVDRGLESALRDAGTPIYGFLAYMRLAYLTRGEATKFADAVTLLQQPDVFGLHDRAAMIRVANAAREFLETREPTNAPPRPRFPFIRGVDPDTLSRVEIAGRRYIIEGRISPGDKSDVVRAAWDDPLTERVVIKIGDNENVAGMMRREVAMLERLGRSAVNGTPFFRKILPEVVATGTCASSGHPATVFRYKNRYDWTLADAMNEYRDGVDPRTMVWMWNRTLTLLAWLQLTRIAHCAIVPEHMLLHPVNHGVTLIDWSYAVPFGSSPADVVEAHHAPFHPPEIVRGEGATAETDIAMSARCMIAVLGGNPEDGALPDSVPDPIAEILRVHARYDESGTRIKDALELEKTFGKVAEGVYGPRKYLPFEMPRRSR